MKMDSLSVRRKFIGRLFTSANPASVGGPHSAHFPVTSAHSASSTPSTASSATSLIGDHGGSSSSTPPMKYGEEAISMPLPTSSTNGSPSSLSLQLHSNEGPMGGRWRHPKPSAIFPVRILPYLYLGNDQTAKNRETLKTSSIRYVINVTSNLPNYFDESTPGEEDIASPIRYLRIPVDDSCSHDLANHFPEAIAFIEHARAEGASVLVHCFAGISRSVTVCLAYLMYSLHATLDEAFDLLLKHNGAIAPNFSFMESLNGWERRLFTARDREEGLVESMAAQRPKCETGQ